jgi:translation initiation factor 4A
MDLDEDLLRGIYAYGFENPSEIQQLAIKPILMRKDIFGQARSGTGKTGTFLIATIQLVDKTDKNPQGLILAPTRELAEQITKVAKSLSSFMDIKIECFVGGKPSNEDIKKLQQGVQIIVGTPGRVEDLISKGFLKLNYMKIFVLDEADEMLSRGFVEQIQKIICRLGEEVQIALFSATLTQSVKDITTKFMKPDSIKIYISPEKQTLEGIPQYFVALREENMKIDVISDLYHKFTVGNTIIFCSTIRSVDFLAKKLTEMDFAVSTMHGCMTPDERDLKINELRSGNTKILITTDVLSRGIDIQQLSMVVNYELPTNPEIYIHRIGRCGRFGRKGIAINLICPKDVPKIKAIEDLYKTQIKELNNDF